MAFPAAAAITASLSVALEASSPALICASLCPFRLSRCAAAFSAASLCASRLAARSSAGETGRVSVSVLIFFAFFSVYLTVFVVQS
jgi:hypothetical protein